MNTTPSSHHAPAATPAAAPFYPSLVTTRLAESARFYHEHFGFRAVFTCDTYIHLTGPGGAQLGLMLAAADNQPPAFRSAVTGQGFWLNLDVADADAVHERLRAAGVEIVSPPADQWWGDRNFVARDPNGVHLCIAHRLPAAEVAPAPAVEPAVAASWH